MIIIEYYLLPEAGYQGNYIRKDGHYLLKKGTIAELLHDAQILWSSEFDKKIPSIEKMNGLLRQGYYPRVAEWDATEIEEAEYEEVVKQLLSIEMERPYWID